MKRYLLPRKANNDDRPVTSTTTSSRQIEKLKVTLQAEIHKHSLNTHFISPAQNPSKKRKTTSDAAYDDQEITVLEEEQVVLPASPSTAPNANLSDVRPSMASTSRAEGTRQTDFKLGCLSKLNSDDRRIVDVNSKDDIDDDAIVPKDTTALTSWPNCWTLDQWKYFKSANDWLFAIGGNLGCSVCKAVSGLEPSRTNAGMKTKLPAEWTNGTVAPTLAAQLSSLRKKMFRIL